jgi:hypothetical protein
MDKRDKEERARFAKRDREERSRVEREEGRERVIRRKSKEERRLPLCQHEGD